MTQKDVQDYLEKGMFGTPKLKPDEQNKYLGTFRERIYLSMTIAEMKRPENLRHLKTELTTNPGQQLLINGGVPFSLQNDYMKAAQDATCNFKIVASDNQGDENDAIGLVYVAETAVNVEPISVTEKYASAPKTPPTTTTDNQPATPIEEKPKKKGFFSKLFK